MELLDELYLSENNKAGPYFVLGLLRGAPQLRVLDLSGCEPEKGGVTDARMGKITSAFSALPNTLEVLYFTHNSLSGEDLGALLEACESRQIRLPAKVRDLQAKLRRETEAFRVENARSLLWQSLSRGSVCNREPLAISVVT